MVILTISLVDCVVLPDDCLCAVLLCSCLPFHVRLMITLSALFCEISLSVDIFAIVSLLLIHSFIKKHWRYRDLYFENPTSGGRYRQCFCFHAACVTARVAPLVCSCFCRVCERPGSVLAAPLSVQRLCRSPSAAILWRTQRTWQPRPWLKRTQQRPMELPPPLRIYATRFGMNRSFGNILFQPDRYRDYLIRIRVRRSSSITRYVGRFILLRVRDSATDR